jgi:hypothetical protein
LAPGGGGGGVLQKSPPPPSYLNPSPGRHTIIPLG